MEDRKKDHIDLAFSSRLDGNLADNRFDYEPMMGTHSKKDLSFEFADKKMRLPIWFSSMTGGTKRAGTINKNLAQACAEFGMGMGLGSCRILLDSPEYFDDFNVRPVMGDDVPLFANIGICQLEQMMENKTEEKLDELIQKLQADGLVIHINPMQEAFQPEGDLLKSPPIEILKEYLAKTDLRIIVKEVGQGFGKESLRQLLALPLEAIEFGALGGTNFSLVELNRSEAVAAEVYNPFIHIGHTAENMTQTINQLIDKMGYRVKVNNLIISGGISSILDGYYLTEISRMPAIFGMGSAFLRHSMGSYDKLRNYIMKLENGLQLANNFLKVRQ
nr:isopentenyl-diphosphate delta-isomerase [uncultured Carboxylicivirga sp.]